MDKKAAVLGSGKVGQTLAHGLRDLGYSVMIGSRAGGAVDGWEGSAGTFADAAKDSDVIILAVKGSAAEAVVADIKDQLAGKIVIDTTNPIADKPPEDSVLSYFTSLDDSLMERLQLAVPEARFVKAFNSVGHAHMVKPRYTAGQPSMFICGDDELAKKEVAEILDAFGWDVQDMGGVKSARAIEPLCMLWCIPGMLRGEWSHAFKLLEQ